MSQLEIPLVCMRWTVDTRNQSDSKYALHSSALTCRGGKWSLYYLHFRRQYFLGLQKVTEVSPHPFDVSVQVEESRPGQIATDLSQKTRCTDDDSAADEDGNVYRWTIWRRSASVVERSLPDFGRDGRLQFLVVIRDGYTATLTDVRSTISQTEDIEESRPAVSASVQTECQLPEVAGQSGGTVSISVQTALLQNTPDCLESLSDDLSRYMDQGSDPDVEFKCGGESIAAHGAVVCARSPVMASMLTSDMLEGRTRVVKVPNMEPDVFQHFLRYLYTGTLPDLTLDLALNLYEAGDQYAVLGLARRCSRYLLEHLSVQDACDVLVVADTHSDGDMIKKVIDYMVETRVPLVSDRWSAFCDDHPKLANKVLNSVMKVVLK